jgi:hypothetical protein
LPKSSGVITKVKLADVFAPGLPDVLGHQIGGLSGQKSGRLGGQTAFLPLLKGKTNGGRVIFVRRSCPGIPAKSCPATRQQQSAHTAKEQRWEKIPPQPPNPLAKNRRQQFCNQQDTGDVLG